MRYLLPVLLSLFFTQTAFAQCDQGEKRIRFGIWSDSDHQNRERAAKVLGEAVNKELQGKFCLDILSDIQKFKGGLGATALQNGEVEMVASSFATLGTFAPAYKIFELPFAFSNIRAVERFQATRGADFVNAVAKNGLQPLAFWHGSFSQLSTKRPVYHPTETAGLRFRKEGGESFPAIVSALFATARTVAENDLTIALQSEKINAQFINWVRGQADGSVKILGGIIETNHQFSGYQLMTSKTFWTSLDTGSKKSLIELIGRIARQTNFDASNRAVTAKRTLMRSDIAVRALTNKQRLEWKTAMQSVWEDDAYANQPDVQAAIQAANRQP